MSGWSQDNGRWVPDDAATESPLITNSRGDEIHPSYGMIRVSHARGSVRLHGSEIPRHEAYIRLVISEGRVRENGSLMTQHHSAGSQVLVLELSQAQYAAMISAPNVGDGVPCTIARREGRAVPRPPLQETSVDRLERQGSQEIARLRALSHALVDDMEVKLSEARVSKKRQESILSGARRLVKELGELSDYSEHCMIEATEDARSRIGAEIEALMTTTINRLGRAALAERVEENGVAGLLMEEGESDRSVS